MIEYVKMNCCHIEGMIEVEEECFASGFARQTFEKELENKISVYVVAEEQGRVLGYAGLWNICGSADIMNVGVRKDFRRCGIGTKMLKRLIEISLDDGVFEINLEVRIGNTAARRLYSELGFEEVGVRKRYYDGIEDAVLMKLTL